MHKIEYTKETDFKIIIWFTEMYCSLKLNLHTNDKMCLFILHKGLTHCEVVVVNITRNRKSSVCFKAKQYFNFLFLNV